MTEQTLELPRVELSAAKRAVLEARLRGRVRTAGIAPRPRGESAPLSFAQERLWFLDRLQPGSTGYNVTARLRLGAVDPRVMERALAEVVRRHEVLRTTFREVEGVPVQDVRPAAGFALPLEDLSALGAAERQAEVRRRFAAQSAHRFDLTAGPLFRAVLLRLGADEHVLLLAMHHVVTDGWSMGILFRELRALYDAFLAGGESPLAPLPLQYADYAAWQRQQGHEAAAGRGLAYWTERLAGAPGLLELPADRPRPAVPSYRGAAVPVQVSADAARRLRALARAQGATPFMVLLAAFQLLLSRWSGTADVVVGSPVAGRTRAEVQELIGLFVNTLVLRTDLSGDPSFRALLGRVRETVLGAYEHQDTPFERLVDALRPERTLGHAPLFQVLFQLDDDAGAGTPAPVDEDAEVAARFDLTLVLRSGESGIHGELQYATDLFDRGTARRMAEHLSRVLEQAAEDPELRVSRMALMGPAERAAVAAWNRTDAPYSASRCIHELFERQARLTPGAVAVAFGGASLTYAELDARANRLANHLVRLGVGPEVRVGICMERGVELLPAILGVMKAGGAWVPADPAHPAERIGYVLGDADVRVVLTQDRLRGRLAAPAGARVVSVDAEWPRISVQSAQAPAPRATSENLAYVIYTSGSTGRPKGVAMHHRGVVNYIEWGVRHYGADRGGGSPVFSSMAVDLTITNLLPLFAGLPVRLLPEENAVEALAEALRQGHGFGAVKITPVHLSLLTPLLSEDEARAAAHTLVIGADFLSAETTVWWQDHAPGVRLMNEYGPTETVVGCSAYTLPAGLHRAGPVPVGGPIQNLTFHVLDEEMRPVPISLPGELYIGGAGVARGYLGRPALSAEKFVPDPFASAPGARMYRTGDRARWLPTGELMILGRTDHQVKVRGYRVELGEIEGVLRRVAGVRDCLVSVREDRPGDRRLVAYVVAAAADADPAALRGALRERLPEYMVPAAFVRLDAFPQTPTGKLDRAALPAPERAAAGAELEEPASYLEARLIQLWEELLGVPGVGPTQNFFELGGNSLLALRLFAQVRSRLGCELPVSTLFAGGTVRHMAHAIQRRRGGAPADEAVVALQPDGALPPLFLVHSADRGVTGYVSLVRHLGAGQPTWGVRDTGHDMARPLAVIAADHVRALRAVQPAGPYHLCGWSFGGFVAYEMAVQLQAAGEAVAFVGLMDTVAPALDAGWPRERDAELPVILAAEAAERMRRPFVFDADTLEGVDADEQVRRVMEAFRAQGPVPAGFDEAALGAGCRIVRDRYASRAGYRPGRFAGTLTLFRAGTVRPEHAAWLARYGSDERHTLGWCLHADAVEVHEIPGTHATLASEPHVRTLAERMRASLAHAHATGGAR